ncbi:hypothetical protein ACFL2R_03500 [Patescibacteria group bacterium]
MPDRTLCNCGNELETLSAPRNTSVSPFLGCKKCNKTFTMIDQGRIAPYPLSFKEAQKKIINNSS